MASCDKIINSITIEDDISKIKQTFIIQEIDGEFLLLNQLKKPIGSVDYWVDDSSEIPDKLKTDEGIVMDPDSCECLLEYKINKSKSVLPGTIYRKYRYNRSFEKLQLTNEIVE